MLEPTDSGCITKLPLIGAGLPLMLLSASSLSAYKTTIDNDIANQSYSVTSVVTTPSTKITNFVNEEVIMNDITRRLDLLLSYPDNWDGYNAIPPSFLVGSNTKKFLSKLMFFDKLYLDPEDVYPTPYGTIVLEWIKNNSKISVEVGDEQIGYYTDYSSGHNNINDGMSIESQETYQEIEKAISILYS